jgi:hypothetical protein
MGKRDHGCLTPEKLALFDRWYELWLTLPTQRAIAAQLGVSRQRVQQLCAERRYQARRTGEGGGHG